MTTKAVLEKLLEVERALQSRDCLAAHMLVIETQECILQLERELIETQARKVHLPQTVPSGIASNWSLRANALQSPLDGAEGANEDPGKDLAHSQAL